MELAEMQVGHSSATRTVTDLPLSGRVILTLRSQSSLLPLAARW